MKSIGYKDVLDNTIARWITAIAGMTFLLIGVWSLYGKLLTNASFDHNYKFAIAATAWGVILLFASIRKQINSKKMKKAQRATEKIN